MAGACLVVGPGLLLLDAVISPDNEEDAAAQLAVVARHADRWYVSDAVVLLALALLVPAVVALARPLRSRGRRWGHVGLALALPGLAAIATQSGFGFVEWAMVQGNANRAEMAALLARTEDAGVVVPVTLAAGLLSAGLVALSVGRWRTRTIAAWPAAALAAGAVAVDVGYSVTSRTVTVAGAALTFVALVAFARPLLSSSDGWEAA